MEANPLLNSDLLRLIFMEVTEPQFSCVCRKWKNIMDETRANWKAIESDPFFRYPVMVVKTEPTYGKKLRVAFEFFLSQFREEDQNIHKKATQLTVFHELIVMKDELKNLDRQQFMEKVADELELEKPEFTTEIGAWFEKNKEAISKIKSLSLAELGLTHVPEEIRYFTGLESLSCADNNLSYLSDEIFRLDQLKTLDASMNFITLLPPEISLLTKLQNLLMNNNQLTDLPTELKDLQHLSCLMVKANKFSTAPDVISEIPRLRIFNGQVIQG